METKFTPGPWKVREAGFAPVGSDEWEVTELSVDGAETGELSMCLAYISFDCYPESLSKKEAIQRGKADAALIASAPELYAALEKAWWHLANPLTEIETDEILSLCADALAKARGE